MFSYQSDPISGVYILRLDYESYIFMPIIPPCTGFFINNPINSNDLTLYSNEIIVSRFDDNSECKCESNPAIINVDCNQLNVLHEGFPPLFIPAQDVKLRAKTLLTANCNITPNNYNVNFVAGNTVSLTHGFSSGNNFRAYLDNCDDGIIVQRIEHNNDNDTLQNTTEAFKTIFEDFEEQIIIYPNPNSGIFTIELAEPQENTTMQIYNTFGQLMLQQQINSTQIQIDLSTFGKGIYFVHITSKESNTIVKKVVVN
ncbi:MAG: T9SS type A sorting domain-containing protein [Bacteroidia bacterium]